MEDNFINKKFYALVSGKMYFLTEFTDLPHIYHNFVKGRGYTLN